MLTPDVMRLDIILPESHPGLDAGLLAAGYGFWSSLESLHFTTFQLAVDTHI